MVGVPAVALMKLPVSAAEPPVNVTATLAVNVMSFDCSSVGVVSLEKQVTSTAGNAYTWFVTSVVGGPMGRSCVGILNSVITRILIPVSGSYAITSYAHPSSHLRASSLQTVLPKQQDEANQLYEQESWK